MAARYIIMWDEYSLTSSYPCSLRFLLILLQKPKVMRGLSTKNGY